MRIFPKLFLSKIFGGGLALGLLSLACVAIMAQTTVEPRRFAIVVGINQYSDPGLVTLQKAQNDAEEMGRTLSRLGGFKAVTVMSGSVGYNDINFPTKSKILDRVEALADLARIGDQVIFFFSGPGINDTQGNSYLLPIDVQSKDATGSGINLQNEVVAKFEAKGIKNVLFLIDACQKTVVKDKGLSVVGVNEIKTGQSVVITATNKGKSSYEDPRGANGLFTRSLLQAFNGEADLNRDGKISVLELEQYLPDAVSEYAFSVGISQTPAVFDNGSGSLQPILAKLVTAPDALSPVGPAPANTVTTAAIASAKSQYAVFRLPEGVRVDLRILDATGREIKNISDVSGLDYKLEPGNYSVEVQDRDYLYYPYFKPFVVANSKVTVALDLKPNFGSLQLSCDPAEDVAVLINGEKRGLLNGSNLRIDRLKSANYELVLSRELYDIKRLSIQIEDGKTTTINTSLNPNFFTLDLRSANNLAATVFVDGSAKGYLPFSGKVPFRDLNVRVVPSDNRYQEWLETLRPATKGRTETRLLNFVGRSGTLEITTNPSVDATLLFR